MSLSVVRVELPADSGLAVSGVLDRLAASYPVGLRLSRPLTDSELERVPSVFGRLAQAQGSLLTLTHTTVEDVADNAHAIGVQLRRLEALALQADREQAQRLRVLAVEAEAEQARRQKVADGIRFN